MVVFIYKITDFFFTLSLPTLSDGDCVSTLRPCDREAPELCVKYSKSLHWMDLCCRTHHGRQLPGTDYINHTILPVCNKLLHYTAAQFSSGSV